MLEKTIQIMDALQQRGPLPEKGTPPEGTDEIRLGKIFTRLKEMEVLKEEVERKNYLLQSLYELTGELNALEQGEAVYRALLYFSMGVFGVSKGSILLYDPPGKKLTTYLEKGLGTTVSLPCDDLTLTLISGINFPIIPGKKEHEIVFFNKFGKDIQRMGGEVWVPLVTDGTLYGILSLGSRLSDASYSPDDLLLLSILSGAAVQTIKRAQLVHDLKAANRELEGTVRDLRVMKEIDALIHSALESEALYSLLLDVISRTMEATSAAFVTIEEKSDGKNTLVVEKILGEGLDLIRISEGRIIIVETVERAIHTGSALIHPDPNTNTIIPTMLGSFLCVPLLYGEKTLGAIIAARRQGLRAFSPADLGLFMRISGQISIALENRRLLFDYLSQKKEAYKIRGLFEQYLSPQLVEKLLDHDAGLPIGGQKKDLSILIADIRGFVNISEQLSSEELVDLLTRFYTRMVKVILRRKGIVDKFIGDAVMAIFGAPIEGKELTLRDSERAVLAAVEMEHDFAVLVGEWNGHWRREIPMSLGIGVCSGNVFIGNIGSYRRMEYTVIGKEVNLAARLSSIAHGGQILINEPAYFAVKDTIFGRALLPRETTEGGAGTYTMVKERVPLAVKKMTPIKVKGLEREVVVYEVAYS